MSSTQDDNSDNLRPRQQGSEDLSSRSPSNRKFLAPRNVIELVDLDEIHARWGIGERRVYRAAALGLIRAYGRPGRQKYYSADEIAEWLSSSVIGRQLRWSEFDSDQLAV